MYSSLNDSAGVKSTWAAFIVVAQNRTRAVIIKHTIVLETIFPPLAILKPMDMNVNQSRQFIVNDDKPNFLLWDNDGIIGLYHYVLGKALVLDDVFIVDANDLLFPVFTTE